MNKKLLWLVLLFSSFSFAQSSFSAEKWLFFSKKTNDKVVTSKVLSDNWSEKIISVRIPAVIAKEVSTKGGVFTRLALPGEDSISGELGTPLIPVIRRLVEVPFGTKILVSSDTDKAQIMKLDNEGFIAQVYPVQPPVPKLPGAADKIPFVFKEKAYKVDGIPDIPIARILDEGILRGHRLVKLEIRPFEYNPAANSIIYHSEIEVHFTFPSADRQKTEQSIKTHYSPVFQDFINETVLPSSFYKTFVYPSAAPSGFLVICADALESSLTNWVLWKKKVGYDVTVVKTSTVGSTTTAIKNYIVNAYNTWSNKPVFVLFVGDTDTIPTFMTGSADDIAYTDLDGAGYWTPDVLLGRWPARTTTQLNNIMAKTLQFEKMNMPSTNYFKDTVWLASDDHSYLVEPTHEFCFDNYVKPTDTFTNVMHKVYERLGGATADFASNVNAGRAIVCYSGHGYGDGTGTASVRFVASDVQALTNSNKPTNVTVYACGTNLFNQVASFGEVWLTEADKGSVSYWGTSDSSLWDEDDCLERKTFKSQFNEGQTKITSAHYTGLIQVYLDYQSQASYYFRIYNLMGDPTLDFVTRIPQPISISSASQVPPSQQNYNVNISTSKGAIENALVGIYKDGTLLGAGYTNASGNVTISIDPITPGTMVVRTTAHNCMPASKSVVVQSTGCGSLSWSSDTLGCSQTGTITLVDADLNINSSLIDHTTITVSTKSNPTGISVILTETGVDTGQFQGSVNIGTDIVAYDGQNLVATYADQNCQGNPQIVTSSTMIDCKGPIFTKVAVDNVGTNSASISWTSSESSDTWLEYFTVYPSSTHHIFTEGTFSTNHTVNLTGLSEFTCFFFIVGGTDKYNNFAKGDNNGKYYSFSTYRWHELAKYTMDSDPGWTTEGDWAWGQPTGSGGDHGNPDPTSGYTGDNVYGYNLYGDYSDSMSSAQFLTSNTIDCSSSNNVKLEFYRWLDVEKNTYDHANIQVSGNGGTSWTTIWQNSSSDITDNTWTLCSYDISSVAKGSANVKIRWGMGGTDSSYHFCGWNIDDVKIITSQTPGVPALNWFSILLLILSFTIFWVIFSKKTTLQQRKQIN